ncbi:MAG: MMPL family transporter, partial [Gemmatimonadales bacterium]
MRQESEEFGHRFAVAIYRWRVPTTILALAFVGWIFTQGIGFIGTQTSSIMHIGDVSDGRGTVDPQLFNPSLDVWFTANDETMGTFREIEDRFVAEDYLVVTFEVPDQPNGVFDRESLSTIERLTDSFLTVPGVRHVRSLTHSPWIRWGPIADADGAEEGLIITDLVESASALSDPEIIERMIAVLGAHAAAARVGEDPIRAVLGPDADFADYIGDPLLLGTLVNTEGTATAIQIQVIRPHVADDIRSEEGEIAADLYTVQYQRRALRGVEHILRRESGRAVPTPEFERLTELLPRMPGSPEKDAMKGAMRDPSRAFVVTMDGTSIQKFHEYEQGSGGQWIDTLDANHLAPSSFSPEILSPYTYRLAGIPTFERNFEITGTADAALLPLAWLATFIALFVLFRSLVSAVLPMVVVLVSVLGTVGALFWSGHLFNNLTAMLPNMMTVIGVADAVHLVAAYLILRPQHSDRRSLITDVIRRNALPVFLTSITTAVGFYSLLLIDLQPVRELAAAMGFGSLLAYVVTMTLVPLLLSLLPLPTESKPNRAPKGLFSEIRSERLAAWVVRRHRPIIAVSSVLTIVALLGVSRVQIDADPRTMFPKDNKVISEMAWIEEHLGGVGDLELVFSAPGRTEAHPLSPDQVERLEELRIVELGEQAGLEGFDILTMSQRQEL